MHAGDQRIPEEFKQIHAELGKRMAASQAASGTRQLSSAKIEAVKTMPRWEWWRAYGRPSPHLR